MSEKKSVSCVIFLFNEEDYIEQAIQSVLSQTHVVREIIVSDDFSTDSTPKKVRELAKKHPQIKYVLSERKGKFHAYKTGLKQVTSDYFFIMAGDDAIESDYVEYGLELIRSIKQPFFYSNAIHCDQHLNKIKPNFFSGKFFGLRELLYRNWAGGFLFGNKIIIGDILKLEDDRITFEDWICVILLAKKYDGLIYSHKAKYLYRRHPEATTVKKSAADLRKRDIQLYKFLLENDIINLDKYKHQIERRLDLNEFMVRRSKSIFSLVRLLLSDKIMFKEKVKLIFSVFIRNEDKLNSILKSF